MSSAIEISSYDGWGSSSNSNVKRVRQSSPSVANACHSSDDRSDASTSASGPSTDRDASASSPAFDPRGAHDREGLVARDARDPAADAFGVADAIEVLRQTEEHGLPHVFRVGASQPEGEGDGEHEPLVPANEIGPGFGIPRPCLPDETRCFVARHEG